MDIERTMQFLVEQAARADVRMTRIEEHAARRDEQAAKRDELAARRDAEFEKRMARLERQMKGVQKLLLLGATEIAEIRQMQREQRKEMEDIQGAIQELTKSQQKTDKMLQTFLRSFHGNGNGNRR